MSRRELEAASYIQQLKRRVEEEFLPAFCAHPERSHYTAESYEGRWEDLCEVDAKDCLLAIDQQIVSDQAYYFLTPRGRNKALLLQEIGSANPRRIRVDRETIITFSVLARLHFELGWPKHLLSGEVKGFAFDAAAFLSDTDEVEFIACEVKPYVKEYDELIRNVHLFVSDPARKPLKAEINAYRKVVALRLRKPPYFWAIGPNRQNAAFAATYRADGVVDLREAPVSSLQFPQPLHL